MKNWFSYFHKIEKSASRNELPDEESLAPFTQFTGRSQEESLVLAACMLSTGRRKEIQMSVLFEKLVSRLSSAAIETSIVELIADGLIEVNGEDSSDQCVHLQLCHALDVALHTDRPQLIQQHTASIESQDKEILRMYGKAMCFLNHNMALSGWKECCHMFLKKSKSELALQLSKGNADETCMAAGVYTSLIYLVDRNSTPLKWLAGKFSNSRMQANRLYDAWAGADSPLLKSTHLKLEVTPTGKKLVIPDLKGTRKDGVKMQSGSSVSAITPSTLLTIKNEQIEKQALFYNKEVQQQADGLMKLLKPSNFRTYVRNMKKQKAMTGITVLLSGEPGTGKTELARQLAKSSGRDLLLFEVSEQRDMFYGESEKKVKQLFDYYADCAQDPVRVPILCFNEADSIFQQRMQTSSNTSQTENAVQAILLNELEKFNGILICTTNRPEAFDGAFSRRFLMQLNIGVPDEVTRTRLLKNYFPTLRPTDCIELAKNHIFTATILGNFHRKWNMNKIISKKIRSLALELQLFLEQQAKGNSQVVRNMIGFSR